jgi:hypothetical protein
MWIGTKMESRIRIGKKAMPIHNTALNTDSTLPKQTLNNCQKQTEQSIDWFSILAVILPIIFWPARGTPVSSLIRSYSSPEYRADFPQSKHISEMRNIRRDRG